MKCYQDGEVKAISESTLKLSRLPPHTYSTHRLGSWSETEGTRDGFAAVMRFEVGKIDKLLLYGTQGLGKTHLAMALGWRWLTTGRKACYYQVEELLDELRNGYKISQKLSPGEKHLDSYEMIMNFVKKVRLLILDDMGAHKDSDWANTKLDEIIDYRYMNHLATVITANTLELPERILDRFREGEVVRLRGKSYRQHHTNKNTG